MFIIHRNIERERLEEEHTTPLSREKIDDANSAEHKSSDIITMSASTGYIKESVKLKRSVRDHTVADDSLMDTSNYHRAGRYPTKKANQRVSKTRSYASDESHTNNTEIIALLQQTSSIP